MRIMANMAQRFLFFKTRSFSLYFSSFSPFSLLSPFLPFSSFSSTDSSHFRFFYNKPYRGFSRGEKGFSLIELSVALIIIGLIAGPFFTYLSLYYKEKARAQTLENLQMVNQSIARYFRDNGHYPCPAPLSAAIADSGAGIEGDCFTVTDQEIRAQGYKNRAGSGRLSVDLAACVADADDGICTIWGNGLPDDFVQFTQNFADISQAVKIGAVPYRSLGLPFGYAVDGYDHKLLYAVTRRYATPDYQVHLGAIDIQNRAGESLLTPPGSAQYILLSHGPDGKGGFGPQGVSSALPCDLINGVDAQNCDADAVFVDEGLSTAQGAHYFDDVVFYRIQSDSLLWQTSPFHENNIYNATRGNVGIGTDDPQAKLDVNGHVRVIGDVNAAQICDENGQNCFAPDLIGGDGMFCRGQNEVMIGIADARAICAPIRIENLNGRGCPQGQFLAGITTQGQAVCRTPSWLPTPDTTIEQ